MKIKKLQSNCAVSALVLSLSSTLFAQVDSPVKWEPLYEPGQGGATVSVQVSPHDPSIIISGGDMLGAARSTDRGELWSGTFGFSAYEMSDVTYHPTDPNVVWFGSCMGPYKSTDGGVNFVEKRAGMPPRSSGKYTAIVEKIIFNPTDSNQLYAIGGTSRRWSEADTYGWVWKSTDAGESWQHISTLTKDGSTTDQIKGVNLVAAGFLAGSGTKMVALGAKSGVYRSDDAGVTWTKSNQGLPHENVYRLATHPTDANVLWVSLGVTKREGETLFEPGGIFKSTDGGATWSSITGNLPQDRDANTHFTAQYEAFAVSPVNPDVMWACDGRWNTGTIYKTEDGGTNWKAVATKGNVGHADSGRPDAAMIGDAFRLNVATFGGCALEGLVADPKDANVAYGFGTEYILRTTDGGATWTDISALQPDSSKPDNWRGRGFTGWCSNNVAYNPYKPGQWILQGMDAARAWVSDDDLQSFRYPARNPHPWLGGNDVSFSRDGKIFITTGQFGQTNGVIRSTDGGATFKTLGGGESGLPKPGWDKGPQGAGVFVHPDQSDLVWAVLGGKMMHSSNGGETWAEIAPKHGFGFIAADPTKPGRFYVTGKQGVFVTEDGQTFTNTGGPRPAERGRINCDSLGRVYACQWRNGRTGVWRYTPESSDVTKGKWERLLDENLAFEVNADPIDPNRLALVTSQDPFNDNAGGNGVWISSDAGKSWTKEINNLPMLRANAVTFDPIGSKLIVGTYGRGFFTAPWPKDYAPAGERTYAHTDEDTAASAVVTSIVVNGRMTDAAGELPANWPGTYGNVEAARDTSVFKSEPASLRVRSTGGDGGQAFQQVNGLTGHTVRLSGTVKSEGAAKVSVAVQFFDADWKKNEFKQIKYIQNDTDWTPFDSNFTVPAWAARFNVLILSQGEGSGWLDDVELISTAEPVKQPVSDASGNDNAGGGVISHVVKDLGGLDYTFGESWKNGSTVTVGTDAGITFLQINATEHGGGGMVLNGADITPAGETHLAIRAKLLPGNEATQLNANLMGPGKSVSFNLKKLSTDQWTTVLAVLPGDAGIYKKVDQIQFQGANFSAGAKPLKILIDRVGTTTPDAKAEEKTASSEPSGPADPFAVAPAKDKPNVPAWGFYPQFPKAWMQTFKGQLDRTKKGVAEKNIEIVFIGDSITQGWGGEGKAVWKEKYAPLKAVNYGIGGDSTRQVLYRIENGLLDGLSPKLVVLMIGTNNLYGDFNAGNESEIAAGVEACVAAVRAKAPGAKILLMGILPRQNEWFSGRIAKINTIISQLADGETVRYLDMSDAFAESMGKVRKDLFGKDQLHLVAKGYEVWAEQMSGTLDELLK